MSRHDNLRTKSIGRHEKRVSRHDPFKNKINWPPRQPPRIYDPKNEV